MSTLPPVAESPLVVRSPFVSDPEVTQRVTDARRATIVARLVTVAGVLAASALVALALAAWSDWYWEWSTPVRAAMLALIGLSVAAGGWRGWQRWIASYSLWRAAANVEQREPRLGQRLRTTLDYGDPATRPANASPRMVESLHADTRRMLVQTQWSDPRQLSIATGALGLFAVSIIAWGVMLATGGDFRTAAGRTLLLPWEYTEVTFKPVESVIKAGESLQIDVQVTGRPVPFAKLRYRLIGAKSDASAVATDVSDSTTRGADSTTRGADSTSTSDWKELDLVPQSGDETSDDESTKVSESTSDNAADENSEPAPLLVGALVGTLDKLAADVEFEVLAGPRPLPLGRVRVLQPLTLVSLTGDAIPPAYTGLPPEKISTPECSVREGSQVTLRLKWNRVPAKVNVAEATPVIAIQDDVIELRWEDLRATTSFDLIAEAADGIQSDPQRVKIRVQLDQKPKVQFVEPPEELEVTPTTEVSLNVSAGDDLGLHKVGILCQVGGGPMQTIWEQDFAGAKEPVAASTALLLEDHEVTHQDGVTYYAFAEDNYFGEPRRVTTPLRFIDIRPFQRAYQMLDNGGS